MFFNKIPIRYRITLGYGLWLGVLFISMGWGLFHFLEKNFYQSVDSALLSTAKALRDAKSFRKFTPSVLENILDELFPEKYIRPYAQLMDLSGRINMRTSGFSVSLPVTPYSLGRAEMGLSSFETFEKDVSTLDAPFRQVTIPVLNSHGLFSGEIIQVGASLESTYKSLRDIQWVLFTVLPIGGFLALFLGFRMTVSSLKPVRDMTRSAKGMGIEDLSVRLPYPLAKDEIYNLAVTFNEMLDRHENAFQKLRRFSSDVSHELRTSLSVLRGEAELALRKERHLSEYVKSLATIKIETEFMSKVIEDLLLLAKVQSKTVAVKMEWIEINKFLEDLEKGIGTFFKNQSIKLVIKNRMPGGKFLTSESFMHMILRNLLQNSLKHSKANSEIELEVYLSPTFCHFLVTDFGEGIPEESIPHIFDTFYRVDSARNRKAGGVGIGLSLAKALTQAQNGSIEVQSKINEGTAFHIALPQPG